MASICLWNGRGCQERQACDAHVVFAVNDADRITLCSSLITPATPPVACAYATTAVSGNYGHRCEPRTAQVELVLLQTAQDG